MTIKDIARQSGYAIATVSRVLNGYQYVSENAQQKIMQVVRETGFQPNNNAKRLKQHQNSTISIIVKGTRNHLFAMLVEQLQGHIKRVGYTTSVHYIDEDEHEVSYAERVSRERRPLGILFLGGLEAHFQHKFHTITLPSVLVTMAGQGLDFSNLSSVAVDDEAGGYETIRHLLAEGHQTIGVLGGNPETSSPARQRLLGCLRAFQEAHVPFSYETQYETARYAPDSAYQSLGRLITRRPDLTAVFCMSDVMAIGALRALVDADKRVPEDIALIGFDGLPDAQYTVPRLTTSRQDVEAIAQHSVRILCNCIRNQAPAEHLLLPTEFVAGESG